MWVSEETLSSSGSGSGYGLCRPSSESAAALAEAAAVFGIPSSAYDLCMNLRDLSRVQRFRHKVILITRSGVALPPMALGREAFNALLMHLRAESSIHLAQSPKNRDSYEVVDLLGQSAAALDRMGLEDFVQDVVRQTKSVTRKLFQWHPVNMFWQSISSSRVGASSSHSSSALQSDPTAETDDTFEDLQDPSMTHQQPMEVTQLSGSVDASSIRRNGGTAVATGSGMTTETASQTASEAATEADRSRRRDRNSNSHDSTTPASNPEDCFQIVDHEDVVSAVSVEEMEEYLQMIPSVPAFVSFRRLLYAPSPQRISLQELRQEFMSADGVCLTPDHLRHAIYMRGLAACEDGGETSKSARREVWPLLLGVYPWTSSADERQQIYQNQLEPRYRVLETQWSSMTPDQEERNAEFRETKHRIDKDVVRTDRQVKYYSDDGGRGLRLLRNVLLSYSMYNFDLGYCQGMSDFVSPLLLVMQDDVLAFWCFVRLMEGLPSSAACRSDDPVGDKRILLQPPAAAAAGLRVADNFLVDQSGIQRQLNRLGEIVKLLDPYFYLYLDRHDLTNMFVAFRWILVLFKREFEELDSVSRIWEALWSNSVCADGLHLFMAAGLLLRHARKIVDEAMGFDDVLRYVNGLAGHLQAEELLLDAEAACQAFARAQSSRQAPAAGATTDGLPESNRLDK